MDYALLLGTVKATLRTIPLEEAYIHDDKAHVDGFCEGSRRIVINTLPSLCETLCHEALHAAYPRWSEDRVRKESRKLMATLGDADVRGLCRLYQRRKKTRNRTVNLTED